MKDRVMHDGQRIHVLGQRKFRRPMKDADLITYKEAKELAKEVLYDFEYREWRAKQVRS